VCGRWIQAELYGVTPSNPGVFVASVAALATCALLAAAVPAWRASRLDPTAALRQE
jgi:ABC-type lipoprotein release transport system permease subunit